MKLKGLAIVGGIVILIVIMAISVVAGMGEIKKMTIGDVDLTSVADGVYTGSFHKGRWTYDVGVTVVNHKIAAVVNTNNRTNRIKDFNEKISAAIVAKQSPKVDVVSGATVNTKAYAKAVETALSSGAKK